MPLRVSTISGGRLRVRDDFGGSVDLPVIPAQSLTVAIPLEDQPAKVLKVSTGGTLRVRLGFAPLEDGSRAIAAAAANVNGVGASFAASVGTSVAASTVAGVGGVVTAQAEAVGTSTAVATVSGVGASFAASVGTAAAAATVSGATGAAGQAAGTASASATVSGAGAARAASTGASAASAAVSGAGLSFAASTGSSAASATVSGVGATASSFDPASLFGSGERGFFFDFTTANCYTNTTRTTNATLADVVAGVTDLSGNGNHASMSTTGSRPAMDETSGLQHVTFDGVDDRLDLTVNMAGATAGTIWAVISKDGDVDDGLVTGNDNGAGNFSLFAPISSSNFAYRGRASRTDNSFNRDANSASTYPAPDLAYLVVSAVGDNSANPSVILRRNGSQVGTAAFTTLWSGLGSQTWRIGNATFNNQDYQGKIYAVGMIGRALTSGELSDLEAWCATRGGI